MFPVPARNDAVMHFAALAYVGESVAKRGRYYDVNVHGTQVLLEAMVRLTFFHFFSSSCAIYREPACTPINNERHGQYNKSISVSLNYICKR